MKKLVKSKTFLNILDVLKSSGYVDYQENVVRLSQLGRLFGENLRQAFLAADHSNSTFRYRTTGDDRCSFFGAAEFQNNFESIKQNFQKELPLALLEENDATHEFDLPDMKFVSSSTLSQLYFIKPTQANQHYFKVQRQRKIWWMRCASSPGGLVISDTKDEVLVGAEKAQLTTLNFRFGFGDIEAERISLITLPSTVNEGLKLRDPDTGRKTTPAIINSTMSPELAALILLTDGIDSSNDHILHINRKLAPFQIFVYRLAGVDTNGQQELLDLSQYVTTVLRRAGIRSWNLPKFGFDSDRAMQKEIVAADKLGVPYIIVLDDASLKSGLLKLRNRETRISETIHVSDVPEYLLKIFGA